MKTAFHTSGVQRAASASVWSALDLLFRQGAQFGVSVVLARLLVPADFGLIALLSFFAAIATMFVQGGFATALVQRTDTSPQEESAVFWFGVIASIVFGAAMLASAGALSRFYGLPLLRPLMGVAAAQILLSALGAVQSSLLARELRFAELAKVGVVSSILSGSAAIIAAVAGLGIWSLAIQMLVAAGVSTAMLWWISPWKPIAHFNPATLRRLFAFGSWLSLSSLLDVLYNQGFALLLGKLHGVRELGLYNRAASTQQLPANVFGMLISRVALPLFATKIDDPIAVRRGMRLAIVFAMLGNVPIMIGLALLSPRVINVLFGDQWASAAPILRILALSGILLPLHIINIQVLIAHGASSRFFRVEIVKKLFGIICIVAGSFYGVLGLAWGQVIASFVALGLNAAPNARALGYGAVRQLRDISGLAMPVIAMIGTVIAIDYILALKPIFMLALQVGFGALAYCSIGLLFRIKIFYEGRDLISGLINPAPQGSAEPELS